MTDPAQDSVANVKAIFMACSEAEDEGARRDILVGVQPEVSERVRKLLAAAENSSPLDVPLDFGTLASPDQKPLTEELDSESETVGSTIRNYKLLEQIGEGGMGSVFMAQQLAPVRRKVALKIIKPGMDSRQVVARFEAERQALALMDHTNIAKVLDGGKTDHGRPYFVMELVRGIPITEFVTSRSESLENRLHLFVDLCSGVQHAHQRGLIHRDLKPSNVLVTLHDDIPVVKIIDFGIAKAINQELTEKTLFTQFAGMVGTPLYMSPEQAELSGLDVDTRSDVYSLGVLLYELLSGTPPIDRETLREKGLDEIRRMIRETIPPRPSQRLSTIRNSSSSTIDGPPTSAIQWHKSRLSGELDWIVMKAIEKQRERRYQSSRELSDDVRRYLDGQVVQARPPRLAYLATKWISNHRILAVSAVIIACVTAIAFGLVVQERHEAIAQANRANSIALEEAEQRSELEVSLKRERALKTELRKEKETSEQRLYRNQIRLASFEWEYGNPAYGRNILQSTEESRRRWEYGYLNQLTLQNQHAVYSGNTESIVAAFVAGDQDCALTVDKRNIHFWNRDTGEPINIIQLPEGRIMRAALHPDGMSVAVMIFEKSGTVISVHECPTGKLLGETTIPGVRGGEIKYHPSGEFLAVCGYDRGIFFFDSGTLKRYKVEIPHTGVKHLIFPENEPARVLAADFARGIVEHQIPTAESTEFEEDIEPAVQSEIEMCLDLNNDTFGASWSMEKSLLATTHNNSTAKIWRLKLAPGEGTPLLPFGLLESVEYAKNLHTLRHPCRVTAATFMDEGRKLVTAGDDAIIRLWAFESETVVRKLKGHEAAIRRMGVSPDNRWLISSTVDGDTILWDLNAPEQPSETDATLAQLEFSDVPAFKSLQITCIATCPDNRSLVVGTQRGRCGVWDLQQQTWTRWRTIHRGPVWDVAFGEDPTQFASCGIKDHTLKLWTMELKQPLAVFETTASRSVDIDTQTQQLANGFDLFSVAENKQIRERPEGMRAAASTAFSPDGEFIAAVSVGSQLRILDRASQKTTADLRAQPGLRKCVVISPDSRFVACSGDQSKIVSVFDLANNNSRIELRGHLTDVASITFLDNSRLVSCSESGSIRVWDATSPTSLLRLSAEGVAATHVAASHDRHSIFAACSDRRIRQWKIDAR